MRYLLLILAAATTLPISCERHEFEGHNGTKQLHHPHGSHHAENATPDKAATQSH